MQIHFIIIITYNAVGSSDTSKGSHPIFGFVLKYYKINICVCDILK